MRGRDPAQLLGALRAEEYDVVICCTAPSPRGLAVKELAAIARTVGCDDVYEVSSVSAACQRALDIASVDDAIVVSGSMYVVGEARPYMIARRIA